MKKIKKTIKLFLFCFTISSCSSSSDYKISDHFDGSKFYNPGPPSTKNFFDFLKWKMTSKKEDWPKNVENQLPPAIPSASSLDTLVVTFVGHSTFLIQVDGKNILFDPIWSERASPITYMGPKRVTKPGIEFSKLPRIDAVLISHNHYDHMDEDTIRKLDETFSPLFVVPLNNKKKMQSFGARNIVELDWWETLPTNGDLNGIGITLTPAKHWSSRIVIDRNDSLWGGFFVKTNKEKIFFAGDTGEGKHFEEIEKRLGAPTLSFIPIGAYEPRWFMREAHLNPEEAVGAHLNLKSKFSLGMHFGTFQLSDEGVDSPVQDLELAVRKLNVENFKAPRPGQQFSF